MAHVYVCALYEAGGTKKRKCKYCGGTVNFEMGVTLSHSASIKYTGKVIVNMKGMR